MIHGGVLASRAAPSGPSFVPWMSVVIQRMDMGPPVEVPGAGIDIRRDPLPNGYVDNVKVVLSNPKNRDALIKAIAANEKIPKKHKSILYQQIYDGEKPTAETLKEDGIRYIAGHYGILLNNMMFAHFGAISHQDDRFNDPRQYENWGLLSDRAQSLLLGPFNKGPLKGHEGIQNFDHMFRPHINIRTRDTDAEHEQYLDNAPSSHPDVTKWKLKHSNDLNQFGAAWDVLTKGFISNDVKMPVLRPKVSPSQLKRPMEM